MNLLKSVYADLIEKRLWPVAVVLLLALVAVPFLLGRGGGDVAEVPTTASVPPRSSSASETPSSAAERAEVGVETAAVAPSVRPGPVHDPFAGTRTRSTSSTSAPAATASPSSSGSAAGSSGGASSGGSSSASSSPGASSSGTSAGASSATSPTATTSTGTTPTTTTPTTGTQTTAPARVPVVPASQRSLQVTLGVSPKAGARVDRRPGSLRLAPLPSAADPVVLFLGMLEHKAAAVFMLPDGATAQGEGRCVPRPSDCQALELPVGGESYVDVPVASGGVRELRLTVPSTRIASWTHVKQADSARQRVSRAGLTLVRAAIARQDPALSYYRFSKRSGLLVRWKHPPRG